MALEVHIKKKIGKFCLNVDFEQENSHTGILGASGCGKSMTLKCIAGIVKPDEGKIILNGKILFDSVKKINLSPQQRNIGYLFQNYALFPNMTVSENIAIGIKETKDKRKISNIVDCYLEKFHLIELENRYPSQLSGGQQQRVALARMLATKPDIIMLDEPFSALDSFLKEQLQREMLHIMKEYDGEVMMVSHSRDEIYKLTEKVIVMDGGNVIIYDDTKQVFEKPVYMQAARLTGCKNISRAQFIDDYQVHAIEWNSVIYTEEKVTRDVAYVGIRARDIVIRKSGLSNITNQIRVKVIEESEAPFYRNYIVRNENSSDIWIKEAKSNRDEEDSIREIIMPSDKILLLRQ